ncbi:zinc finger protein 135-like [Xyrichtys novacula]|uniref:Zinc finger protein 135-like n=1 Tax=Xyrichtys novacula TaxID=13765 RepID=A0AAV1EJJ1_XYRNO|nr:zinc finger protein 135-like [Xyrichtys novacula]
MFKTEELRTLVEKRLMAVAEEIFNIFEKTIRDYEATVLRSKQEDDQQQQRGLMSSKAPLQLCGQESNVPPEQDHCETETEPQQIKEEQEEELAGDKQEDVDTKDSFFNIIYVQRNVVDGELSTHPNHDVQNEVNTLSCNSCDQFKSESNRDSCNVSEPTEDSQTSEVSGDKWRPCGETRGGKRKPQQAGETSDRLYTCSICNKTFRIKSILTRHMKTHTGEKPHSCSVCGKGFIQRSYLQTHMNSHSGQKPHTCRFCGRGFSQVGNMNAHIRIHTGEKPHSCSDCGKSFREKADLIKHRIIHSGEKPYICTVCNMKFTAQSNLKRHIKTHSGERPFSCTSCGKKFIRKSHLIIHIKTHAGGNQ